MFRDDSPYNRDGHPYADKKGLFARHPIATTFGAAIAGSIAAVVGAAATG